MVHCFLLPFGLVFSVQSQTATRMIERRICVIVQDSADSNLGEFWKTFVKLAFSLNIAKLFTIKFTKRSVNVRNKNVKDNLLAEIMIMVMSVVMTSNDDSLDGVFYLILFSCFHYRLVIWKYLGCMAPPSNTCTCSATWASRMSV